MRVYNITAWIAVTAMCLLSACAKESYKSYTCDCVQEKNGDILDRKEYGVQATNLGEAGLLCNDVEDRINNPKEGAEANPGFDCRATP
ncbi:MAG TPA: hypothetical protein VIN07_10560 [Flavipsychrobacter sp.]